MTCLSKSNLLDLERIFLDGFIIDGETKITLSKNITDKNEPLYLYLRTVSKLFGIHIKRRDTLRTLNITNNYLGKLVKTRKCKELTFYSKGGLKKKMLEGGWLNFLPNDLYEKITNPETKLRTKNLILMCSMGILSMFKGDQIIKRNKIREENKKREMYNI